MEALRFETNVGTETLYLVGSGAMLDSRLMALLSGRPVCFVVDDRVAHHHGALLAALLNQPNCLGTLTITGGEYCKSMEQLVEILGFIARRGLPKHGIVVAVGGGSVCDVVSLAAMLSRRGLPLVLIPTTLLAQIDAAIGGKNGINFDMTKNLIGHFYHPTVVACDQAFLTSLATRDLVSGVGEAIKVFCVSDRQALMRHTRTWRPIEPIGDLGRWRDLVGDAVRFKLSHIAQDPYERSSRRLLNYGHAFAHLLEERSAYRLLHGEAVLLGMLIENEVSRELGIAGSALEILQEMILELVSDACREFWIPFAEIRTDVVKLRQMRRGMMNLVCLAAPGEGRIVDDASEDVLAKAFRTVEAFLSAVEAEHRQRWMDDFGDGDGGVRARRGVMTRESSRS
jgi:3-dehydroquinate synthase